MHPASERVHGESVHHRLVVVRHAHGNHHPQSHPMGHPHIRQQRECMYFFTSKSRVVYILCSSMHEHVNSMLDKDDHVSPMLAMHDHTWSMHGNVVFQKKSETNGVELIEYSYVQLF